MKRSMKRRILPVVLTMSMMSSLFPVGVCAAEGDMDIAEADSGYMEAADEIFSAEETLAAPDGQAFSAVPEEIVPDAEFTENPETAEPGAEESVGDDSQKAVAADGESEPELQEFSVNLISNAEEEPDLAEGNEAQAAAEEAGYALMNIPYAEFYQAVSVSESADYDAISSATNKVGNYGMAGGAFHSEKTAEVGEDGTVTAVGGANGARNKGVIWPVKISDSVKEKLGGLGGREITSESKVTTATVGRGNTSASYLVGYEVLTEKPAYSYYYLSGEPSNYLTLDVDSQNKPQFSAGKSTAASGTIELTASYGTHHADVQLALKETPEVVSGSLINAVVITTSDESSVGLVHVSNIWLTSELGWNVSNGPDLGGKTIKSIRYYCSVKDSDTNEVSNSAAPDYQNYVYEYSVNQPVKKYHDATNLKAEFDGSSSVTVSGLPEDIQNAKATVYHTDGGRPATLTYLTATAKEESGNEVPEEVKIENGKIALTSEPVDKTEYTIAVTSENYFFKPLTAVYTANTTPPETDPPETDPPQTNPPETPQINAKKIPLQVNQSSKKLEITGLAEGDHVASWSSSNKKIVKVNKNGKITAGNKTGKAVITATLASGRKIKVKVTVQKKNVATEKISGLKKEITLKKGKSKTLKPVITPITSQDKVTYKSSDEKIAAVTATGVIKAKKTGTVKITVTSGKKKAVVTVKVKKEQ